MSETLFTEATLREPLRAHRKRRVSPLGLGKASAVLVPLFEREGEAHTWLVRRAQGLRDHSGQVAFPGGKRDAGDDSLLTTALREAEEEIALARGEVDVLGALDDYFTITGYAITPYVAWTRVDVPLAPNAAEVTRVFAAPLRAFLEEPEGSFPRVGWRIDGEFVWGATAAIAKDLVAIARELRGA